MANDFPYTYSDLIDPTLQALKALGGSGNIDEIEEQVIKLLNLTDKQINAAHREGTTKLSYRLAWARYYLKHGGFVENSSRGVWSLTPEGRRKSSIDAHALTRQVTAAWRKTKRSTTDEADEEQVENGNELSWQEQIVGMLQGLKPDQFERFCQRLLRELGFTEVQVTGRSGDGGIDGKGLIKLGGVLAFHVVFQCKRFKDSVSSAHVRDFRGAMVGRADKGLFLTTGTFTRDAKREAQRDGAPPIDLLDGVEIAEQMKALGLGVQITMVERVSVVEQWFSDF